MQLAQVAYESYMKQGPIGTMGLVAPVEAAAVALSEIVVDGVSPRDAHAALCVLRVPLGVIRTSLPTLVDLGYGTGKDLFVGAYDLFRTLSKGRADGADITGWYYDRLVPLLAGPRMWFDERGDAMQWQGELGAIVSQLGQSPSESAWSPITIAKLYAWMDRFPIETYGSLEATLRRLVAAVPDDCSYQARLLASSLYSERVDRYFHSEVRPPAKESVS